MYCSQLDVAVAARSVNFATLVALRRASSLLSSLAAAAQRRPILPGAEVAWSLKWPEALHSAGGLLRRYQPPQDYIKVFQISSTEEAKEDGVLH
jgi:hypothetical protein